MKSGRPIDISKSSLVSLKAELSRKQEEVDKAKSEGSYVRPTPKQKFIPKSNPGVEERNERDIELTEKEVDQMKKSREVLELKARLYEKLESGSLIQEKGKSEYLVDFNEKSIKTTTCDLGEQECENEVETEEGFSDSDSEWVEYTDCLGRTRKCHRDDLDVVRKQDEDLSSKIYGKKNEVKEVLSGTPDLELMSNDMHKEILRQKWEEQERKLANKDKVYYEDIRFDEARSHGVGYYQFSTEEAEREAQQAGLKKAREETERRQAEARALRERRERAKQARLIAARQRQRNRLGLPPIEIQEEENTEKESPEPKEEGKEEQTQEELEAALRRAAHVRPWDAGKDGIRDKVMTQEEWVESKRSERPSEFAPSYIEDMKGQMGQDSVPVGLTKNLKRLHPRKEYHIEREDTNNPCNDKSEVDSMPSTSQKIRGVEIPPPMSFDYYNPSLPKQKPTPSGPTDTEKAIEAGLKFLRDQVEKDKNAKERGLLGFM